MPSTLLLRRTVNAASVLVAVALAVLVPLTVAMLAPSPGQLALLVALCAAVGAVVGWRLRLRVLRLFQTLLIEQKAENLRFDTAINNISQGLCFFDGTRRLIVCNRRYAEMYGLTMAQVQPGTSLEEIVDHRYEAGKFPDVSRLDYLNWRGRIAVSNQTSDTVANLKDGSIYAIHHQPMPDGGWVATHEDITERCRATAQIERLARRDALTDLANRLQFRDRLLELLTPTLPPCVVAVVLIDLDHFKAVNDSLGHPVGDLLLCSAAERLNRCVRSTDLVARLGGDEFAIIQIGASQPAAAHALSERVVREFALPFILSGHEVRVGASVGVAMSPEHGTAPDDLLKNADLALYDAKSAGRGTYSIFRPQMVELARNRRELESGLRQAEARGELELHYQPIVSFKTDKIVGFEALLRWRHAERGMLQPDQFIPLAEETGLIESLGDWVLREAFRQAAGWPAHMAHLRIAVNLSPVQLKCGRLLPVVAAALRESGLSPSRVELEITESVRLDEDAGNLQRLHSLRALGVSICIDDFGVGYSSLSYLRSFPFTKIKIDRSFVTDVVSKPAAAAIVRAITAMGASLGMSITAEGIEDPEQLECLRRLGCDEAQGFLLGRPVPAQQIDRRPATECGEVALAAT